MSQEKHTGLMGRELVGEVVNRRVDAEDIGQEVGGQEEWRGNKKRDQARILNYGEADEGIATARVGLEGLQEVESGVRLLGERMKVDLVSHIKDNKMIDLQVIDHYRMPEKNYATKEEGRTSQETWKRLSRGDNYEEKQHVDTDKENNWRERLKRSRQREKGEEGQDLQEMNEGNGKLRT